MNRLLFPFHLIPVVVGISKAFATMATTHFSTFSHSSIISFLLSFNCYVNYLCIRIINIEILPLEAAVILELKREKLKVNKFTFFLSYHVSKFIMV